MTDSLQPLIMPGVHVYRNVFVGCTIVTDGSTWLILVKEQLSRQIGKVKELFIAKLLFVLPSFSVSSIYFFLICRKSINEKSSSFISKLYILIFRALPMIIPCSPFQRRCSRQRWFLLPFNS